MNNKKINKYLSILLALIFIFSVPLHAQASDLSLPNITEYNNSAVTLNVSASGNIEKIMARTDGTDFVDISSSKQITISSNTTVYLVGYTAEGDEHYYQHTYNIFDYTSPTLSASSDSDKVYISASDDIGVNYVVINGSTYSSSELSFSLDDFNTDTITITAYDYAGNASETRSVTNQRYIDRLAREKADAERAKAEQDKKEKERKALEQELAKKQAELEKAKRQARVTTGTSSSTGSTTNRTTTNSGFSQATGNRTISNQVADSTRQNPTGTNNPNNSSNSTNDRDSNSDRTNRNEDPEIERLKKEIDRVNEEKENILKDQEEKNKKRSIYSFVSKDGKEFHVIRPKGSEDDQENIMLLTEVTPDELIEVMNEGNDNKPKQQEQEEVSKNKEIDILRQEAEKKQEQAKTQEDLEKEKAEKEEANRKQKRNGQIFLYGVLMLVGGAVIYYLKVYKKKEKDPYEHDEDVEIDEDEIYTEDEEGF